MRQQFPLFQSHLDLAPKYWAALVRPKDIVVDATCGNGHDTLQLAHMVGPGGLVYAYDIQQRAVDQTVELLQKHGVLDRVQLICGSHETLRELESAPRLIVYNLGYLPGSDKEVKTSAPTSMASIRQALSILRPGGALSITAYPGHPEGALEEEALRAFFRSLPPTDWSCAFHQWLNRQNAPSLFLVQKPVDGRHGIGAR